MLNDVKLPLPPLGKTEWPWIHVPKPYPLIANSQFWPRISIVTPSYNQGEFLEETIRSILLQNYPNLEYIIMDGGSTDNSVEIIKKYEPWLAYWVSEKDGGQADAIYRGFEKATGEIIGWINSDDYLLSGALKAVSQKFLDNPNTSLVIGGYVVVRANGREICKYYSFPQTFESLLCAGMLFGQMASFWKRKLFFEVGGFEQSLRFCFDYDLFLKLTKKTTPVGIDRVLAAFRLHDMSKSMTIWEKVGAPEKSKLQEKFGIFQVPVSVRETIEKQAHDWFRRNNHRGLLLDVYRDPKFFLKRIACIFRDTILNFNSGKFKSGK